MPFEPDATVWGALLSACRTHGNIDVGKCAAEKLFKLEPQNAATYVQLSNTYAAAGRWDDAAKVRKMMKERGVKKDAGCSWIEVKSKWHAFVAGDNSHPQLKEITEILKKLSGQMKEAGYLPDSNFVMQNED
jgi:pentatricopeptide repeat protein